MNSTRAWLDAPAIDGIVRKTDNKAYDQIVLQQGGSVGAVLKDLANNYHANGHKLVLNMTSMKPGTINDDQLIAIYDFIQGSNDLTQWNVYLGVPDKSYDAAQKLFRENGLGAFRIFNKKSLSGILRANR